MIDISLSTSAVTRFMFYVFLAQCASMTTKGFTEPHGIDVPYEYREAPIIRGLKL